jgi:hypothetical protein
LTRWVQESYPLFFEQILGGKKQFEICLGNHPYKEGDTLYLEETAPGGNLTGRNVTAHITSVTHITLSQVARVFIEGRELWNEEDIEKHGLAILGIVPIATHEGIIL